VNEITKQTKTYDIINRNIF